MVQKTTREGRDARFLGVATDVKQPEPVSLRITNLVKSFGKKKRPADRVFAVDDVSVEIQPGELFTLLGPSGCGKTTTLRSIAGLERPDSGEIMVGNKVLFSSERGIRVPSSKRGLGMVFQSYAVWPHMNVFNNVAFPLKVLPRGRRPNRKELGERVERVLSIVRLEDLADRPATDLSGGQQQRLALARALIMEPPVLLLDEPLSNLDALLREEMVFELKRLQREVRITSVYVTHDQVEALAMSNRIAVMDAGRIEQVGKPRDVYGAPSNKFVAKFIGTSNFVDAIVSEEIKPGLFRFDTPCGPLAAPSHLDLRVGSAATLSIRPEHMSMVEGTPHDSGPGIWSGTVVTVTFLGDAVEHLVTSGPFQLRVRSPGDLSIRTGTDVTLRVLADQLTVLQDDL